MNYFYKVGRKLQILYFQGSLRVNGMFGRPAQTRTEIQIFKRIFDSFTGHGAIKIFEWGSGFSTIYYAGYLRKKNVEFKWHSVDNNKTWHEKVQSKVDKKNLQNSVQLHLEEFIPFWEKPGWGDIPPACGIFGPKSESEINYVKLPKLLNEKFDIVIIDARFRRHCIQIAKEVLLPGGIVVMHDAEKEHYHTGLSDFQHSKFLISGAWYPFQRRPNRVWVGSMENSKIIEVL